MFFTIIPPCLYFSFYMNLEPYWDVCQVFSYFLIIRLYLQLSSEAIGMLWMDNYCSYGISWWIRHFSQCFWSCKVFSKLWRKRLCCMRVTVLNIVFWKRSRSDYKSCQSFLSLLLHQRTTNEKHTIGFYLQRDCEIWNLESVLHYLLKVYYFCVWADIDLHLPEHHFVRSKPKINK